MSVKQTGQDLTCVRLIPTISDDRILFLTTDSSGKLSIYEKLTKTPRNNNNSDSIKESTNSSTNFKVQRKSRISLSKNKLISASIIDEEHYIIASDNEIFTVGNDSGNNIVQTLKTANVNSPGDISSLSNLSSSHAW